ncbi:MAG: ABC transporter permease [Polyangiales bacterium]
MRSLDRKLWRDLWHLRTQAITISLVVGAAVASYVCVSAACESLHRSRDDYYARERFADVFVMLEAAPRTLATKLASIAGVAQVAVTAEEPVRAPMASLREPATGRLMSLPPAGQAVLNDIFLTRGRRPMPGVAREAVVLDSFATAHGLGPGDTLDIIVRERLVTVRIVGTAMSPEYVMLASSTGVSKPDSIVALWMTEDVVDALVGKRGAFNRAAMSVQHGASIDAVIASVDRVLKPYGGRGATDRSGQLSHRYLEAEMGGLEGMATVVPLIFLAVAIFLVNVVMSRIVELEREQIAVLKALGYANLRLAQHYLALVLLITSVGAGIGLAAGMWLGEELVALYAKYFRFPVFEFEVTAGHVFVALGASVLAGVLGVLQTLRSVMRLPPAEAMRPAAPPVYRRSLLDRLRIHRWLGQAWRMVLREMERRPARLLFSALGIAAAIAILVAGRFSFDAVEALLDVQFGAAERGDVQVQFVAARPTEAIHALEHVPGVWRVEPMRSTPVRVRAGHHARTVVLTGHPEHASLHRVVTAEHRVVPMPWDGVVLTTELGRILGVEPGDDVDLEFIESPGRRTTVRVAGFADELFGLSVHARMAKVEALMGTAPLVTGASLAVDGRMLDEVCERIGAMPGVASVATRRSALALFEEQTGENMRTMTFVIVIFASIIAIGVVYNNARVSLSTRSRELASLRVLGFTRAEISRILLGEIFLQAALGVLPGLAFGRVLAEGIAAGADAESFRFPLVISSETYAFAVLVAAMSTVVSALIVRRRIDHLDLIGVLKTRGG